MRENTVVVILGNRSRDTKTGSFKTTLESGALRTRLQELGGSSSVEIATANGTATLSNGGSSVIGVDKANTIRLSNHRGPAASLRGRAGQPVSVVAGFGSTVPHNRAATPPKQLPPSPIWTSAEPVLAPGWSGQGGHLHASWNLVPQARRYRLELATDPDLSQVVLALEADAKTDSVDADRIPVGDYYLGIASIDDQGLESVPSVARPVHVAEIALPPGATADHVVVGIGSSISLPPGIKCRTGTAEYASSIQLMTIGKFELECNGANAPLHVEVANVVARSESMRPIHGRIGEPITITVVIEGTAPPITPIVVHSDIDATLIGDGPRRTLVIKSKLSGEHVVTFLVGATTIGEIHVDIKGPSTPAQPHYEIGVVGGGAVGDRPSDGFLGIVVGTWIEPRLASELNVLRLFSRSTTQVGLGLAIALFPDPTTITPRVRVGAFGRVEEPFVIGGYAGFDVEARWTENRRLTLGADANVSNGTVDFVFLASLRAGF
ncbi:MAG: hypothetical protein QM831_22475 [Kofleriaceae bacterium]